MLCARVQAKKCLIIFYQCVATKTWRQYANKDRAENQENNANKIIWVFIAGQRHFQKNTAIVIPFLGNVKRVCHEMIYISLKAYNNK